MCSDVGVVAPPALLAFSFSVGFNQCPSSLQVVCAAAVDFYSIAWRSPDNLRNSPPDIHALF